MYHYREPLFIFLAVRRPQCLANYNTKAQGIVVERERKIVDAQYHNAFSYRRNSFSAFKYISLFSH